MYDPPTAAVFLLQSFREWSGAGKPAPPANAKSCSRLLGKSYGDFSVAFLHFLQSLGLNSVPTF